MQKFRVHKRLQPHCAPPSLRTSARSRCAARRHAAALLPMGPQQLDAYPHMSAVPSQPHLNL